MTQVCVCTAVHLYRGGGLLSLVMQHVTRGQRRRGRRPILTRRVSHGRPRGGVGGVGVLRMRVCVGNGGVSGVLSAWKKRETVLQKINSFFKVVP